MTGATRVRAPRPSLRIGLAAGGRRDRAGLAAAAPADALAAVVIVTDLSAARTRELALRRLMGTVLGSALGATIHPWLPPAAWSIGLGVLAAMFLSYLLHLDEAGQGGRLRRRHRHA
jgi:hypothetical protein